MENPKCSCCRCYFVPVVKSSGLSYKTCEKCRENIKLKNRCIHNKIKSQCRDCGGSAFCIHDKFKTTCRDCDGSAFCIHDKQKTTCRDCDGSAFCIHDKQKTTCRDCDGSSFCIHDKRKSQCRECGDVLKKTIERFIQSSKSTDKKYDRLDIVNFIDKEFCTLLIEESNDKCCYCECDLEYINYNDNLISIERIDNTVGHIKSNVKISCLKCNVKKVGNDIC
jgi:hypothetical protein